MRVVELAGFIELVIGAIRRNGRVVLAGSPLQR
jgi:hypothetical protein